jgi:hypothetical protein
MDRLSELNDRLRAVIIGTCNTIGCEGCDLKWSENGKEKCSATELQGQIMDIEFAEVK